MIERIATPRRTKEIIDGNTFVFKKGYGQNFLVDTNILEGIVEAAGVTNEDCVIEIGPGIGSLTQFLAESAKQVIAIEIDKKLIPILQETLSAYDNIEILNQDVLKTDIDALIQEKNQGKPVKVVANLPYYITTPILMGLLENKSNVETITVMVQKEVAQRMEAQPGSKDYGALSVAVQYYCKTTLDFIVKPTCFMPKPKVDSAVITLEIAKEPRISVPDEELFFHVIRCAFGQRRKTLQNSLYNQGTFGLTKEEIADAIQSIGKNQQIRGEALTLEEFGELTWALHRSIQK